jgi:hypothetical protein
MTPLRWFIVLFWVVVIFMILKGCYDSEMAREHEEQMHPPAPSGLPFPPAPQPTPPPAPTPQGAKVVQTGCVIQFETPPGNFTCVVTVKNIGDQKATGVQLHLRPYRGSMRGLVDIGPQRGTLSDTDPLSQMGTWLGFPDLAPGDSATQTASFMNQPNIMPGRNPDPEIDYKTATAP